MVPFLRKIRKSLLGKSSLGHYMLYAIGEILLVVVGILLALQIDNWNEEQHMREIEVKTLRDLKVEFTENLTDARRVYEGNMGVYQATIRLQQNAKAGVYHMEETDSLIFYMFDWFDYTPKPGASNNLINAGNLNLIQNEELRYLLTLWSGVNAELDDDEQLSISYSQNTIVPFLAAHYPISNLENYDFTLTHYDIQNGMNASETLPARQTYDPSALLNDPVFMSHVSTKKMHAAHNAMECLNVVESCEEILELIEKVLGEQAQP
ncbi:hypothetical protein [Robiginitalea sp.]|uniref:hypothetical protein n=1 Tax=Robiginitalea sp. TaxID=1902411 RepID=UPI003C73A447